MICSSSDAASVARPFGRQTRPPSRLIRPKIMVAVVAAVVNVDVLAGVGGGHVVGSARSSRRGRSPGARPEGEGGRRRRCAWCAPGRLRRTSERDARPWPGRTRRRRGRRWHRRRGTPTPLITPFGTATGVGVSIDVARRSRGAGGAPPAWRRAPPRRGGWAWRRRRRGRAVPAPSRQRLPTATACRRRRRGCALARVWLPCVRLVRLGRAVGLDAGVRRAWRRGVWRQPAAARLAAAPLERAEWVAASAWAWPSAARGVGVGCGVAAGVGGAPAVAVGGPA